MSFVSSITCIYHYRSARGCSVCTDRRLVLSRGSIVVVRLILSLSQECGRHGGTGEWLWLPGIPHTHNNSTLRHAGAGMPIVIPITGYCQICWNFYFVEWNSIVYCQSKYRKKDKLTTFRKKLVKMDTKTCEYSMFCIDFNRARLKCNLRCCAKRVFVLCCIMWGHANRY